jgi:hypothetical protein
MSILSIDLAYRRWSNLGVVVLERKLELVAGPAEAQLEPVSQAVVECEILPFGPPGLSVEQDDGPIDAEILAGRVNHLCNVRGIRVIMLDGPQAWKSKSNGLAFARVSEGQLNTAGKTGLPGTVRPITYRPFTEFCMDVYDALSRRGWSRLATRERSGQPQQRVLVESYPFAAWKSLGIKPLCSKRRARVSDLAEAYAALRQVVPFTTNRPPNHDQLQAIVGGLPGLAIEQDDTAALRIVGKPPRREDGHWREGFIVLPVAPRPAAAVRWLH